MTPTEAFGEQQDPWTGPAQRHDLREMILMALCAVLCGAGTWVDVAEWAEDNEAWLRHYLVPEHGTPSHDTFGRIVSCAGCDGLRNQLPQLDRRTGRRGDDGASSLGLTPVGVNVITLTLLSQRDVTSMQASADQAQDNSLILLGARNRIRTGTPCGEGF